MDTWALIVGLGIIIGIVAGIVQVLQYVQERQEKKCRLTCIDGIGSISKTALTLEVAHECLAAPKGSQ